MENRKNRRLCKNKLTPPCQYSSLIPGLPDEISLVCIAQVPCESWIHLRGVSKIWLECFTSGRIYTERRSLGCQEKILSCLIDTGSETSRATLVQLEGQSNPPLLLAKVNLPFYWITSGPYILDGSILDMGMRLDVKSGQILKFRFCGKSGMWQTYEWECFSDRMVYCNIIDGMLVGCYKKRGDATKHFQILNMDTLEKRVISVCFPSPLTHQRICTGPKELIIYVNIAPLSVDQGFLILDVKSGKFSEKHWSDDIVYHSRYYSFATAGGRTFCCFVLIEDFQTMLTVKCRNNSNDWKVVKTKSFEVESLESSLMSNTAQIKVEYFNDALYILHRTEILVSDPLLGSKDFLHVMKLQFVEDDTFGEWELLFSKPKDLQGNVVRCSDLTFLYL